MNRVKHPGRNTRRTKGRGAVSSYTKSGPGRFPYARAKHNPAGTKLAAWVRRHHPAGE